MPNVVFISHKLTGKRYASIFRVLYIAKKRIVTPGILIDGVLEITNGLKPGEEFIVKGQTLLNEDSRINIIEKVAPLGVER